MVRDNKVIGLLEIKSEQEYAEFSQKLQALVDVTDSSPRPEIGWIFDNNTILDPLGIPPIDWRITRLAMRDRFTFSELLAITTALDQSPMLKVIMDNLASAIYIDLSLPATSAGLMALQQSGFITMERVDQILHTRPTKQELAFGGI